MAQERAKSGIDPRREEREYLFGCASLIERRGASDPHFAARRNLVRDGIISRKLARFVDLGSDVVLRSALGALQGDEIDKADLQNSVVGELGSSIGLNRVVWPYLDLNERSHVEFLEAEVDPESEFPEGTSVTSRFIESAQHTLRSDELIELHESLVAHGIERQLEAEESILAATGLAIHIEGRGVTRE